MGSESRLLPHNNNYNNNTGSIVVIIIIIIIIIIIKEKSILAVWDPSLVRESGAMGEGRAPFSKLDPLQFPDASRAPRSPPICGGAARAPVCVEPRVDFPPETRLQEPPQFVSALRWSSCV